MRRHIERRPPPGVSTIWLQGIIVVSYSTSTLTPGADLPCMAHTQEPVHRCGTGLDTTTNTQLVTASDEEEIRKRSTVPNTF